MRTLLLTALLTLGGCLIVHTPNVSSSVIEADPVKGSIISINAKHCGAGCDVEMLDKAKEVCTGGYSIQSRNTEPAQGVGFMVVRCQPESGRAPSATTLNPVSR